MKKLRFITLFIVAGLLSSCGGENAAENEESTNDAVAETTTEEAVTEEESASSTGVGPVTSVTLGDIDDVLVEKGKELYKANCTACHKIGKRVVGPALKGVTERRSPEWIMNMILNPEEMVEKDPTAKALLAEYLAPMANQSLSEEEARAILEFFRTKL